MCLFDWAVNNMIDKRFDMHVKNKIISNRFH